MTIKKRFLFLCLLTTHLEGASSFLYEPSEYYSELDSPFSEGIENGTIYLETFEDQALNTPGVFEPTNLSFSGGTLRAKFPDIIDGAIISVDGDDGAVDGFTYAGDVWSTAFKASGSRSSRMEFEFEPDALGRYPTYVGIVITEPESFFQDVDVLFRDPNEDNLFSDGEFDPQDWRPPDGAGRGDPVLHRFVGGYHPEGIKRLRLFNVVQADHLQFGYAIPEVSSAGLAMMGLLLGMRRRRKER